MDVQIVSLSFLLVYLFLVAILDLKTKETPYFLSFSFIGAGLLSNIVFLIDTKDWLLVVNPLLASLISYLKYRFGLWGGGDFLVFIGTSLYLNLAFPYLWNFLVFLIFMYFSTLLYNSLYSLIIYVKERLFSKYELLFAFLILLLLYKHSYYWAFIVLLLWLLLVVYKLDLYYFTKKIPVEQLREEDWLAYDVYKDGKVLVKSSDYPEGIDNDVIEKIKKENVKFVYIKDGIPYLPTFFLALIFTIIFYEKEELIMGLINQFLLSIL